MNTIIPVRLLKFVLCADAAASAGVAAAQLLFPGWLTEKLSLPTALLTESGIFLAAYVMLLLGLASAARVWTAAIQLLIVGNVLWSLGCIALAMISIVSPSALGTVYLLLQAGAVLIFAWLERAGLRASTQPARSEEHRAIA